MREGAKIIPFVFDGRQVRTVLINGVPWIVAADVCAILGLGNPRDAVRRHVDVDDRDGVGIPDTTGRNQKQRVVNEFGLYALILGSTLPDAKSTKAETLAKAGVNIRTAERYEQLAGGREEHAQKNG